MIDSNQKKIDVKFQINGEIREAIIRPSNTLLFVLRNNFGLTGSKPGCLNGDCGACTVIVDQTPYKACIMLAVETLGKRIMTIEGLQNTPIQKAFVEKFAFQCGYCTSGFIMNCHALLTNHPLPTPEVVKEWLESNICRCTSYKEIEEAVWSVISSQGEQEK